MGRVEPTPAGIYARSGVVSAAEDVAAAWPTFLEDVLLPVEEDRDGVYHDIRRDVRCSAPVRIAEANLVDLLSGRRICPACLTPSLAPGGRLCKEVMARTLWLRVALDVSSPPLERARAAVSVIWEGYSRYFPRGVFEKVRAETLLPIVARHGEPCREGPGPLVAFTAGDMRLGGSENAVLSAATLRAAPAALVHASAHDGVWLLHDPWRELDARVSHYPALGRVLETSVPRSDVNPSACEIFGVLADDALSGSGSWEDIREWWSAACALAA